MASLDRDKLLERVQEARLTRKLNLGYLDLPSLPADLAAILIEGKAGNVESIDLSSNKLDELPSLKDLHHLKALHLKYNSFTQLPPQLAALPLLEQLDISGNQIRVLDDVLLLGLPKLRVLDVGGNQLAALPPAVARLTGLQHLAADHNVLDILPDMLGDCTGLTRLVLGSNRLAEVPHSVAQLPKLARLDLSDNCLTTVPPALGHIRALKELDLRYNRDLDAQLAGKASEGLSKLLAYLRDEDERERLAGIERLKPVGTQTGDFLDFKIKADQAGPPPPGSAADAGPLDNRCWDLAGTQLVHSGLHLCVFGGRQAHTDQCSDHLLWLTTERMEWHRTVPRGNKPAAREGHSCTLHRDKLVVFGGKTQEGRRLGDVWAMSTGAWTWRHVPSIGSAPLPRFGAAVAMWGPQLVVFGGNSATGLLNDVWTLDIDEKEVAEDIPSWRQEVTGGTPPSLRTSSACCVSDGVLYMHGGMNNFVLGELFSLDLVSLEWRELGPMGNPPPVLQGHVMCEREGCLWMFGGWDAVGQPSQRLFCLDLDSLSAGFSPRKLASRPSWMELDVGMPFGSAAVNIPAFNDGSLVVVQHLLEHDVAIHSQLPDGMHHWNAYRTSPLNRFGEKQYSESSTLSLRNQKSARLVSMAPDQVKLPSSYTSNSRQESAMLEHCRSFSNAFLEGYPHRPPPYLTPRNECGLMKMVCTSLRPMRPASPLVGDLEGICSFVADWMTYEPPEAPQQPSPTIVAPDTALKAKTGDAFDLANLLCSLLLGADYNAMVVVGHAVQAVSENDISEMDFPGIQGGQESSRAGYNQGALPSRQTLRPGAPLSDRNAKTILKNNKYRGVRGVPDTVTFEVAETIPQLPVIPPDPVLILQPKAQKPIRAAAKPASSGPAPDQAPPEDPATARQNPLEDPPAVGGVQEAQPRRVSGVAEGGATSGQESQAEPPQPPAQQEAAASGAEPAAPKGKKTRMGPGLTVTTGEEPASSTGQPQEAAQQPQASMRPAEAASAPEGADGEGGEAGAGDPRRDPEDPAGEAAVDLVEGGDPGDPEGDHGDAGQGGRGNKSLASLWGGMSALSVPGKAPWGQGEHVHAWVLVLPGSRQVNKAVFIEPATAAVSPLAEGLYEDIEAVWNHHNYWLPVPLALPAARFGDAGAFALDNPANWGHLLEGTSHQVQDVQTLAAEQRPLPAARDSAPGEGSEADDASSMGDAAFSATGRTASSGMATLRQKTMTGRRTSLAGAAAMAATQMQGTVGPPSQAPSVPTVDLPPPWVARGAATQEVVDMRCPGGVKEWLYHRCRRESFAWAGQLARWDGLTDRITFYEDEMLTCVDAITEHFQRRADCLRQRLTRPAHGTSEELFTAGAHGALSRIWAPRRGLFTLCFDAAKRADGLKLVEEREDGKLIMEYEGRQDGLVYRSARFLPGAGGISTFSSAAMTSRMSMVQLAAGPSKREVLKVTEKFQSAGPSNATWQPLPPNGSRTSLGPGDIACQRFRLDQGLMEVTLHLRMGQVMPDCATFGKHGLLTLDCTSPTQVSPWPSDVKRFHHGLLEAEQAAMQAAFSGGQIIQSVIALRKVQECNILLAWPYAEAEREASMRQQGPDESEKLHSDFLKPYLPARVAEYPNTLLTHNEALETCERCIADLQVRQDERVGRIKAHRAAAVSAIAEHQAKRDKEKAHLTQEELQAHEAERAQERFRLAVIDKRLLHQADVAARDLAKLQQRLLQDSRLAALQQA